MTEAIQAAVTALEAAEDKLRDLYYAEIQRLVDSHNVWVATGQMCNMWQARRPQWPKRRQWEDATHLEITLNILNDLAELDEAMEGRIAPTNGLIFKPGKPVRSYLSHEK